MRWLNDPKVSLNVSLGFDHVKEHADVMIVGVVVEFRQYL